MRTILLICISILNISCANSEKESKLETKIEIQNAKFRVVSKGMIQDFSKSLKSELMSAINDGGFTNAVSVCQDKAPLIASSHSKDGWVIRRVSEKYRSAENRADSHESEILKLFADTSLQLEFFDEWISSDIDSSYYFYKPIYVGKFCLKCHGQTDEIASDIHMVLKDSYPNDNATGYQDGDLRGMFIVHVPAAQGFEFINSIDKDSLELY